MQLRTRFAPSPTGLLHVGNAYSALLCRQWADVHEAELLLRIEDIDHTRCRPEFTEAIIEDLHWLGLKWQGEIRLQSDYTHAFQGAIERLRAMGVIYPCFCTRKQVNEELQRIASAPHADEMPAAYPGTCRRLHPAQQSARMQHEPFAWRLDAAKAISIAGNTLSWHDASGRHYPVRINHDMVIGRKDIAFSYHLAVVIDDAIQGITHVIRGVDLEASTGIHRLLQVLLGLPEPVYIHHPLLLDSNGERLAKRNQSTTLNSLRHMGVNPERLAGYLLENEPPHWPFSPTDYDAIVRELGNAG